MPNVKLFIYLNLGVNTPKCCFVFQKIFQLTLMTIFCLSGVKLYSWHYCVFDCRCRTLVLSDHLEEGEEGGETLLVLALVCCMSTF